MIYNIQAEMLCEIAKHSDILIKICSFDDVSNAYEFMDNINDFEFDHKKFYDFCKEINDYFNDSIYEISYSMQLDKYEISMINYMRDY